MQSLSLFALLLEIAPAIAGISPLMRFEGRSWTPARETGSPTAGGDEGGLSPVPTEPARHPDFGEMELFKRYQMGSDTCGFASGFKCAWAHSPLPILSTCTAAVPSMQVQGANLESTQPRLGLASKSAPPVPLRAL